MSMSRTNQIGLAWILLASGISIWWGFSVGQNGTGWVDFRAVYYGTRCLLLHHNPYKQSELEGVYRAEGGERPAETLSAHQAVVLYVNVPTSFIVVAPFAMLPWGPAHMLWLALTAGVFILAALLMWNLGAIYAHDVSLFLIFILLVNSEILFSNGNLAGIAISLCVVAVWCFLKQRFALAGILCLAVSLAIKPHDAGLIWLYFLLAGGVYRKRALQTLFAVAVLGLLAILWVSHVAPHWMPELYSNLSATSARGGISNPGPTSMSIHNPDRIIDLQTVISVLRDDPRIYNPASYLVCGTLLLVWSVRTLRSRVSQHGIWLALAAIAALSMLPIYHRSYDAKLLLLTIPACAMLWAEGGPVAWIALLVNTAGIALTGDIPSAALIIISNRLHVDTAGSLGKIMTVVLMRPAPLILLVMSVFYLWAYLRRAVPDAESGMAQTLPA
jgi:hypothetical protein